MAAPVTWTTGILTVPAQLGYIAFDNGSPQNVRLQYSTGTFTANGTTPVVVANTAVTASSDINITLKTVGGTVGAQPAIVTITPGTGFNIVATALDTSVYNYSITG
jgi:hypothetical protein